MAKTNLDNESKKIYMLVDKDEFFLNWMSVYQFAFKALANQYLITYRSKGMQSVCIGDEDMLR